MKSNSAKQVQRITVAGLAINAVLSALKFTLGIAGRSQAVTADAVHSLSDLATDVLVLLGLRFWSAPADQNHPYGHRRIETMITVLIGGALAAVAIGFCTAAVEKLRHPPSGAPALAALTGSLLTILVKEWLFRATRRAGRQAGSPAVVANAWHHRADAFSSVPVVISVAAAALRPELRFLDQVGTLVVALLIFKAAWDIAAPALAELSEHGAADEDVKQIAALAASTPGICSVHRIRTRRNGAGLFVDLHALVDGGISVRNGHDIATRLQRRLIVEGPGVADVVVHIEPDGK